ncbi:MAG: proline--tRNA ligase [Clostridia bacterium]|nr:proline--tRNA ligase [Clostridia bacterium]
MANKKITSRDVDFAQWYTDVVNAAHLSSYSNVKGCIILEPNGYAIWEMMQKSLDKMFKETGHKNVAMPMLIPENLMKKEGDLINGFAPEVAWVTIGGDKKLEERMCIRPTSETLFSDYYASVVNSYRDLPLKYNQWCSVMRWEKETRPFLRSREFWWQEGHTIHETQEEAEEETYGMLEVYRKFFYDYLAIPVITGQKTDKEKFAGAEYTLTVEALMHNGVALQSGTSHYFGQKFSKAYDIKFADRNNGTSYVYQTSWGVSSRMIGGLIMVHSDEDGLVLPPRIAPTQVRVIPIGKKEESPEVYELADSLFNKLAEKDIRVDNDLTEKSPGFKFAEAEVLGIPVRIEVGKRDLENGMITLVRRDTKEKIQLSKDCDIASEVNKLLETIQADMLQRATERRDSMTFEARTLDELEKQLNTQPGFIRADWCGNVECEEKIKEFRGCKSRCIMKNMDLLTGKCIVCGKEAKHLVTWGIQY